ncbi:MAG: hypothetical protein ACE5FH_07115 [Candidatus Zixiibacteriota bacterium]
MRPTTTLLLSMVLLGTLALTASADTESDIVSRYMKKTEAKQAHKIAWLSAQFSSVRINRNNDYNTFASFNSDQISGSSLNWLDQAPSFGLEFGLVFNERFAWSLGGEYWLKLGQNDNTPSTYTPPGGSGPVSATIVSEIKVYGLSTGMQYYFMGHPSAANQLTRYALRAGGSVGLYQATWDLWPEYQNLNLATSIAEGDNISFKGTAPSFSIDLGLDYPTSIFGLALGVDVSYLYLNFTNVAWYNVYDEEIVATVDGSADGRVDLNLSGPRARLELKRFIGW